jgi:predicted RNA binding protein YcfA (HicA-like mRNA interferase family)
MSQNISPRDCIRAFKKLGFEEVVGGKGSHVKLVKGDKTATIPTSKNPIRTGTLLDILKEEGISREEFLKTV